MRNYNVHVISNDEFERITNEKPVFINGFLQNNCDWLNLLEKKIGCPIISIRPSGRNTWNEVLIISAEGYIRDNTKYIHGNYDFCEAVMIDIFIDAENDEYEVFRHYDFPDLSKAEVRQLDKWIRETY